MTAQPLLAWSDTEFVLGVELMDATHKEFIALLNELNEAPNEKFVALFAQLYEHTREHFEQENQLMKESGFPATAEHIGEHERVLGELTQFKRRVDRGLVDFGRAYIRERMPGWFRIHAATMDSALAAHLSK